jgi:hypothetical protein
LLQHLLDIDQVGAHAQNIKTHGCQMVGQQPSALAAKKFKETTYLPV